MQCDNDCASLNTDLAVHVLTAVNQIKALAAWLSQLRHLMQATAAGAKFPNTEKTQLWIMSKLTANCSTVERLRLAQTLRSNLPCHCQKLQNTEDDSQSLFMPL